jgi:hypothetical protein
MGGSEVETGEEAEPAAPTESRSPVHRARDLLIDVAIVAVLGAHLVAFVMIHSSQARYDGEAKDIARWAQSQGVSRVAWPAELRSAVPTLLDAGVTPVLVDASEINAQQLVVNDTPVLVTRGDPVGFDDVATDRTSAGSLVATLVDLRAASSHPLDVGQSAAVEYSLPYVYSPILDSYPLKVGDPLLIPVPLAPGDYVFTTEVFDPEILLTLTLSATPEGGPALTHEAELRAVVDEPQVFRFTADGTVTRTYTLQIQVDPVEGTDRSRKNADVARMHRWSLERAA